MTIQELEEIVEIQNKISNVEKTLLNYDVPTDSEIRIESKLVVNFRVWNGREYVSRKHLINIPYSDIKRLFFAEKTKLISELHALKHKFEKIKITKL
jgi:hypothetical protein